MKILLVATGSIAVYKCFDLLRLYRKAGYSVRVILSRGALEFVKPELFKYLGAEAVYKYSDDFAISEQETVLHIELARWADRLVICPLSANTLSKLATGAADDLMSCVFLSWKDKACLVYPAMNPQMYAHPLTQSNLDRLQRLPWLHVFAPETGLALCGDHGEGRLPDIQNIFQSSTLYDPTQKGLAHRKVLITTGATLAPLDPVRFLTNASSGKTGLELAKAFLSQSNQVVVLAGRYATNQLEQLNSIPGFEIERLDTTEDMRRAVLRRLPHCDLYISAAAIGDIEFSASSQKLKKSQFTGTLHVTQSTDILGEVLKARRPDQKIVGFAAETNFSAEQLHQKWSSKPVDLLIGNQVHHGIHSGSKGFGSLGGTYSFFQPDKQIDTLNLNKDQLAQQITERLFH